MGSMYLKSSTAEIELPMPEFGNTETYSQNQSIKHTRSGMAYVTDGGYPIRNWTMVLHGLTHDQQAALLAFFRTNTDGMMNTFSVGLTTTNTTLKCWPAVHWIEGCRFASPALEFHEPREATYDVTLHLERVSTSDGDTLRLVGGYQVT